MSVELEGTNSIAWNAALTDGLTPIEVVFGRDDIGVGEVQIAVAAAQTKPSKGLLEAAWKDRGAGSGDPVIVAAEYGADVWILGPSLEQPVIGPIARTQAQLQLQAVLNEPNGIAARKKALQLVSSHQSSGDAGFTNHFLFAAYHLKTNVPRRADWADAGAAAQPLMSMRGKALIEGLGFETAPAIGEVANALVLRAKSGSRRAIAVLLDESEQFDQKSVKYQISPVAHGLEIAGREELPWVIVLRQSTLRLYPGADGVGVGQRGQSETYFELDLSLVDQGFAGLLPLIFSADALEQGGSAQQILEESGTYAAELGAKLRDRVYEGVVPAISVAIAERLPQLGYAIDADGLKVAYSLTLRILFRLLFQAYGEDTGLLPAGRNEAYDSNSLQSFIKRDANADPSEYSQTATSIWLDLVQVWDAIFNGNERWAVPAYGGSLFDPTTRDGKLLKQLELPDAIMGPALQNLLADVTDEDVRGPVDFRSLQVREFGTIYEGLLESSLSVAESDLTVDKNGSFLPAKDGDVVLVPAGRPYFHSAAGDRKATGSYYTPKIVVDHLIERSITPTLEAHLAKVRELIEAGNDRAATELFWDFRVADLAMGSAHFLVAAVDKIERLMRDFLTVTPVPGVRAELERLAAKAREALGRDQEAANNINDAQLLRRQVARRCVYGLDINELAVELSRLAIWIHTFVPGLPMSSLDHNLVLGNSLTGIGTVDEALDALGLDGLFADFVREPLDNARTLLVDFANASEADKSEVAKNAELITRAREAAIPARNVFDAAVATRLGVVKPASGFSQEEIDAIAASPEVREALNGLDAAHMPVLFPEVFLRSNPGFDAFVGNPPWEKLHVEEHQWWGLRIPGLRGLPQLAREKKLKDFRASRPDLEREYEVEVASTRVLNQAVAANAGPGLGSAHLDLYQPFAWRFWKLLRNGGRSGVVLPRGALSGAALSEWRREILLEGAFADVAFATNNKRWIFEGVHPQYTVAFAVIERNTARHSARFCGPFYDADSFRTGATNMAEVESKEFLLWSQTAAFPLLPDHISADLYEVMRRSPPFGSASEHWDFKPLQGDLNATSNKALFEFDVEEANGRIPVLAGASFNLWDPGFGKPYAYAPKEALLAHLRGKYQKGMTTARSAYFGVALPEGTLPMDRPRIAFRDVTNQTNTRTTIACLIPPGSVSVHNAPQLVTRRGGARAEAFVVGVMSSLPFDWASRRWVELHLTFELLNALPMPTPDVLPAVSDRLIEIAGRLAAVDERYADWADEVGVPVGSANDPAVKNDLIYELDALVSLLFGLSEDQVVHIFETFHRGWDYQPRLDAVLQHYAAWKAKA